MTYDYISLFVVTLRKDAADYRKIEHAGGVTLGRY